MHIYTLLFVMLGFVLFDSASIADAFMSFKSLFGLAGIPAVNSASLYYLKSNLVLLIIAVVGATPLPKRIYEKIGGTAGGSRALAVLKMCIRDRPCDLRKKQIKHTHRAVSERHGSVSVLGGAMKQLIYIAEDEKNIRETLQRFLENDGYEAVSYTHLAGSLSKRKKNSFP